MASIPRGLGAFPVGCADFMLKDLKWKEKIQSTGLTSTLSGVCHETSGNASSSPNAEPDKFSLKEDHLDTYGPFFRLFYPAAISNTNSLTPWIPKPSRKYLKGFLDFLKIPTWIGSVAHFIIGSKTIPAQFDAPLLSDHLSSESVKINNLLKSHKEGKFPLVLFSHGRGSNRAVYSSVCCDLASRGFVVASVEARDGSAAGTYYVKNEKTEWISYRKLQEDEDEFGLANAQLEQRSKEVMDVYDILRDLAQDSNGQEIDYDKENILASKFKLRDLKGRIDLENVAIVGHSFGAATAINVLANCQSIKCGVCLDIWMLPIAQKTYAEVKHPLVFINSETFHWPKNIAAMNKLKACHPEVERCVVTILGSNHYSASDVPFVQPSFIGRWFGFRDASKADHVMKLHREIIWEFLKKHMDLNEEQVNISLLNGGPECPQEILIGSNIDVDESPKSAL